MQSKVFSAASRAATILSAAAVVLASHCAMAQSSGYASTAEYKAMIEELHADAPSPAFIATGQRPTADSRLKVRAHEDNASLKLATDNAEFTFDKQNGTLTILNLRTKATWAIHAGEADRPKNTQGHRERHGNRWVLSDDKSEECAPFTLELLSQETARLTCGLNAAFHGADGDADVQLHVHGSTPLFGLGERFSQAGLQGINLDVRPADKFGEPGHNYVYVAIPFVYGPAGLGLYADTVFDTQFKFDSAGESFDLKIPKHPVSFYIFVGPDPKAILGSYTALTGRPQMPPLWSFGPWVTALHGKDAVLDTAAKLHAQGVPTSALWIYDELDEPNNLGWPFWFLSYYGDPRPLNDQLHAQGLKVMTYVHPYVREKMMPYPSPSPAYTKGVTEKLLQTDKDGLPAGPAFEPVRTGDIDFTNPAAVDWWQKMLTNAVRDQGWDGWMEDFGEWVADTDHFAAGNGDRVSQVYPLLYHKITTRITQAINPSLSPFSRSGSPGSQQFSTALWGADQAYDWSRDYGLPSVVTAGITAGMSGFSTWGPDILSDGDSKELWIRWAEFGALTPVMRDHPWSQPPGSIDLWHDDETKAIWKKYAILHSSLLPYFAAYGQQAHETGVPILRHTVLEYPNDPRSAMAEYQYFLGKDLLVAPVIEQGATSRKLYAPQGEWVNYWTGEEIDGGRDVSVAAPLDQIPILVRAGSILPFKPAADTPRLQWGDAHVLDASLVWKVYPSKTGKSAANFSVPGGTSATLQQEGGKITIQGRAQSARAYEIVIPAANAEADVTLDGQALKPTADRGNVSGWWFDPSSHELHATFQASTFTLVVATRQ